MSKGKLLLIYTMVCFFPYISYCNAVWGNAYAVHLDPIIKIQKKTNRTITSSSYLSPSEPIFLSLNILNFIKLVCQESISLCLKHENVMFPNLYMLCLELLIDSITIRQRGVSLFMFQ